MTEHLDSQINQHIQHENSEARRRQKWDYRGRIGNGERPWEEQEGVMSVVAAVVDLDFPLSLRQIRSKAGAREVVTTRNTSRPLREVLDVIIPHVDPAKDPLLEDNRVPSLKDFHHIVQTHWEAVRYLDVPPEQRPTTGGWGGQDRPHR